MRVRSSKMRVCTFDHSIFMKFPTGFRPLHIEIYTASRGFPATARLLFNFQPFFSSQHSNASIVSVNRMGLKGVHSTGT